jgi:class 3 adenylate cyclase
LHEELARREVAIRTASLRFDDRDYERRFRTEYDDRTARTSRVALLAGAPGYGLLVFIVDDPEARIVAWTMLATLTAWAVASWTDAYLRRCHVVNLVAECIVSALSVVLVLALPAASAFIVAIPFVTLNFMWIFVFLRPRVVYAAPLGVAYAVAMTAAGAVLWDRYGDGAAPDGLVSALSGMAGGAVVVFAYTAFLCALCAVVAYRLERGERTDYLLRQELATAHERSERLLRNVLPDAIAQRLKMGEQPIADECPVVSVVFADIAGFTTMSTAMKPAAVLTLLNDVFTRFDDLAAIHGLEKIKTIGDAYMAVAGVPRPVAEPARSAVDMGLAMLGSVAEVTDPSGAPLDVRVGIASGPAVAGVIGTRKFSYDLWGDTVNVASRMESHGVPGFVQVDDATWQLVSGSYTFEDRGTLLVKGKGPMRTWLLAR